MKLKELRHASGLSQRELAKLAEISFRTLQHYEQGTRDLDCANLETLLNICGALGCRLQDIITSEELKAKLIAIEYGD